MKKWITPMFLVFLLGIGLGLPSCAKSGCPAEIQAKKVKKKRTLKKKSKINLFPKNMRKHTRNPKF